MCHAPATPFAPTPEAQDRLIHLLAKPDYTLADIALEHKTTLNALTAWIDLPETQAQIRRFERAVCARTRLIAINHLPAAVSTAVRIIEEFNDEESHVPIRPGSLQALEQRRRSRETARRAAYLLLRLTRVQPSPPQGAPNANSGSARLKRPEPCLEELLAQVATIAPALSALSARAGAAVDSQPKTQSLLDDPDAEGTPSVPSATPSRRQAGTDTTSDQVEIPVPHLDLNSTPPPVSIANGNGHAHAASHNEHWP